MFGYYYGFDMYYLVLIVPCIVFAMWAQMSVKSNFDKFSRVRNRRGITAAQAAQAVLQQNGVTGVRFERIAGNLTDHFDPRDNVIRLSSPVYDSTSVAAIGVACHEAGHAVQYARNYAPMRLRSAIIPITQFGSVASWPLLVLGLVLNNDMLAVIGIALFALSTVFQLVTLPVELDASRRALAAIHDGYLLDEEEYPMAKKTLWAAAMTYVAALATSLASLLRLLLIFGGQRRDD
ncbi:MAG: zinc metallopeptidase [Clostridia bacterium]|nr:zinc metallopeptidase [Clostridia bacterium]